MCKREGLAGEGTREQRLEGREGRCVYSWAPLGSLGSQRVPEAGAGSVREVALEPERSGANPGPRTLAVC